MSKRRASTRNASGGHIEERGDGTYRVIASTGERLPSGHYRYVKRTVHGSPRDAQQALARLLVEIDEQKRAHPSPSGHAPLPSSYTVATWAEKWLALVSTTISPNTHKAYASYVANHITPGLGHHALTALRPHHIVQWIDHMRDIVPLHKRVHNATALSPTSILRHYRVLAIMLQAAVYRGIITTNPARQVEPPRPSTTEAKHYGALDVSALIAHLAPESPLWRALILLAVTTGMRRGELAALEWNDIRWDDNLITIKASAYVVPGRAQSLKSPKSYHGIRVVPLVSSPPVTTALRAWQDAQAAIKDALPDTAWRAGDHVFSTPDGNWIQIDWITREWKRFITTHALPPLPFHGLRHTAATILLGNGMSALGTSRLLGHSQPSTTSNLYGHAPDGMLEQAAGIFSALITTDHSHGE